MLEGHTQPVVPEPLLTRRPSAAPPSTAAELPGWRPGRGGVQYRASVVKDGTGKDCHKETWRTLMSEEGTDEIRVLWSI